MLRLTANDGDVEASDDTIVTVYLEFPTNQAPQVNAGSDQSVSELSCSLSGSASDDGLPNPPNKVTTLWSKASGPGDVAFTNPSALSTTASFSASGVYVLRLTAGDGEKSASDDVEIRVNVAGDPGRAPGLKITVVKEGQSAMFPCNGTATFYTRNGGEVARKASEDRQVTWNGANDKGERVANGMYMAVCTEEENGDKTKWKLMVVR